MAAHYNIPFKRKSPFWWTFPFKWTFINASNHIFISYLKQFKKMQLKSIFILVLL